MIEVIREIGNYAFNQLRLNEGNYISLLAEDPNIGSKEEYSVVVIELIDDGNTVQFNNTDIVEFNDKDDFLYKSSPSPRSPDFSPTTKITKQGKFFKLDDAFQQRIIGWFSKYSDSEDKIARLGKYLADNAQKIIDTFSDLPLSDKKNYLLTICFRQDKKYIVRQSKVQALPASFR